MKSGEIKNRKGDSYDGMESNIALSLGKRKNDESKGR